MGRSPPVPEERAPGMMTFLVLSLAHLLLRTLAAREIARPFLDLVRVAHTLSFSCDGEGQGRWRVERRGLGYRIVPVSRYWVV
jgi:hypothetical protein